MVTGWADGGAARRLASGRSASWPAVGLGDDVGQRALLDAARGHGRAAG